MRKLNIDRMRRNVARSTPDEIRKSFNVLSGSYESSYEKWIDAFAKHMEVKHSSKCKIDVYVEDDLHYTKSFNKIITVRAVPYTNLRFTHRKD